MGSKTFPDGWDTNTSLGYQQYFVTVSPKVHRISFYTPAFSFSKSRLLYPVDKLLSNTANIYTPTNGFAKIFAQPCLNLYVYIVLVTIHGEANSRACWSIPTELLLVSEGAGGRELQK